MNRTLLVIDMQNDFIDGALGSPEALAIVPTVKEKIELRRAQGWQILYTRDTHGEDYLQSSEGRMLPVPHCIRNTEGWEIRKELYVDGAEIIDKPTFGYTGWKDYAFEEVELIGLCTDICVVSNALLLKALFPDAQLSVDPKCCAGVTPASHEAALTTMKMCQILIEE